MPTNPSHNKPHPTHQTTLNDSGLLNGFLFSFLSRVSILLLTRDIDIVINSVRLSVRPSVCLSVTRWYCMKTA